MPWDAWPYEVKPYRLALQSPQRALVIVLEVQTYDDETGLGWRYFASEGFATKSGDSPASTVYHGRLAAGMTVTRQVGSDTFGRFAGLVSRQYGNIDLMNNDGGLDDLAENAVDGRIVIIRAGVARKTAGGKRDVHFEDFGRIAEARGDSWTHDDARLSLAVRDSLANYRIALQSKRYAGTGGAEGGDDLTDRTKPLTWGQCSSVPATLVDAGRQIYQVHDGAIHAIDVVYDRGIALAAPATITGGYTALAALTPAAGEVIAAPGFGLFRLGSPAAGGVTVDMHGGLLETILLYRAIFADGALFTDQTAFVSTKAGPGYVATAGNILLALLMRTGRFGANVIDLDSLTELDRVQPAPIGIHFATGDESSLEEALRLVAEGVGAYVVPDRLGLTQAVRLEAPRSSTPVVLDAQSVLRLRRLDLPYGIPPIGWSVRAKPAWSGAARASDLAAGVPDDRRAYLLAGGQTAVAQDAARIVRHPTAKMAGEVQAHFWLAADATAEAARLRDLYAPGRIMLELTVKFIGEFVLGRTVTVVHNRHGLSAGREFVVVGVREEYGGNRAVLRLFG